MAKIYASTSSVINCVYTLSIARSSSNNSNIVITASGTIYGNGSSQNSSSDLYAHLCYDVSPANTTGTGAPTSRGTRFGNGQMIVARPLNKTSIPESGKTFSVSWTITDNAERTFSNCALFLSGSATDQGLAGGAKSYMFIGERLDTSISKQVRYYTQTLSVAAGYTDVSNPAASSIKFNSSTTSPLIVAPNGSITVSWDAGAAGTNNPIKQYEVVLNNTTKTTTGTSYTFSNLNLTREHVYSATVKAIPTISGYGPSQGVQSSRQIKGNKLPNTPTVTITQGTATVDNKIYRLKNDTTIRFNFSGGDTGNTDNQSISYRYATSSLTPTTSNTTPVTNSTDFTPTSTTTYYFWSFDGLEFSGSSVTKKIYIGTDISVSTPMSFSPGTSYSNNGTNYYTAGTHTVTTTNGIGDKTYKWYLQYNTTASTTGATSILLNTTTNINSYSWTYPGDGGWGKRYRIYCVVTDALGSKGTAYGYVSGTTWFTIPAKPSFEEYIYNKWENNAASKIAHSYPNDFYETIVAKGVIDTSINNISYETEESIQVGKQDGVANLVTQYQQNGCIPLKILQANTEKNTSYNLKITMSAAWGGSFEVKYKITRNGYPRISNNALYNENNISTADPAIIKPFNDNNNYNFIFLKPDIISNNNFYTDPNNLQSKISLFLFKGSYATPVLNQKSWTINSTSGYITAPATRGGSKDTGTLTSGMYNWSSNPLFLNKNGENSVGLRIVFEDVFGDSISIDKDNYFKLNCVEAPSISSFTITNNTGTSSSGSVVGQSNTITYETSINFYNEGEAIVYAYIYENDTNTKPAIDASGWQQIDTTVSVTPTRSNTNIKISTEQTIDYTIGKVDRSTYLYFRVDVIQNGNTDQASSNTYYISQRHTNISNFSVNPDYSNKILKYTTTLSDQGAGRINQISSSTGLGQAQYGLQFSADENFSNYQWLKIEDDDFVLTNQETWLINNITTTYTQSHNFTFPNGINFYYVRPVYKTTIGSVSYTSEGDSTIFYDLMPTVSYRKNQIGINIDNTESYSDSVVIISPTTGKSLIKLYSLDNTATIDLDTGELDGFIFDGGTWNQS